MIFVGHQVIAAAKNKLKEEKIMKSKKTTIRIDDTYRVEVDSYNYTLIQHAPETKTHDVVIGYYPSLHHALIGLKREKVATELDELTIDDYINALRKLENWVARKEHQNG